MSDIHVVSLMSFFLGKILFRINFFRCAKITNTCLLLQCEQAFLVSRNNREGNDPIFTLISIYGHKMMQQTPHLCVLHHLSCVCRYEHRPVIVHVQQEKLSRHRSLFTLILLLRLICGCYSECEAGGALAI